MPKEERDLLDVLISIDMSADYITGIFISMMFAGHHTSSGTASWALIELMRHPETMKGVVAELDELYADGSEVSFQALRSIPALEAALKETLRLHPPLIILMRVVQEEIELAGHPIQPGTVVAASPRVSNRIGEDFPDPEPVRPVALPRPAPGGPAEPVDLDPVRRRQAPLRRQRVRDDADEGDLLGDPARLRVRDGPAVGELPRRRVQDGDPARAAVPGPLPAPGGALMRAVADLDLCQAHQMCQAEAPDVFGFDEDADRVVVLEEHPDESLRPQVEAAVRYCPAMALAIEEE